MNIIKKISPQLKIVLSFITLILIGSILLSIPISTNNKTLYLNNLFTSTTSVTITGLTTVDIANTYTNFGKIVIALLIKLGGRSITTITLFLLIFTKTKIGLESRYLMKENIDLDTQVGILKLVKRIVIISLIFEIIGAFIFTIIFKIEGNSLLNSLGYGLFHAISSYNNAGITIFPYSDSLIYYSDNYLFIITTAILIISGGLGTIVIYDIYENKRWKKLKQHSKIVLKMTILLILVGMIMFYLIEDDANLINSFFHSVTLRTAGFYSYSYINIKAITILVMISLMFIGGGPASTAGGVKVTTIYTINKKLIADFRNKRVISYNKTINETYIKKALNIFMYTLFTVIIGIVLISIFNQNVSLSMISFEVVSAISNTGLSLNLTSNLNNFSQIVLIILMIIGRVTVITFLQSFISPHFKEHIEIDYIDAKYIV